MYLFLAAYSFALVPSAPNKCKESLYRNTILAQWVSNYIQTNSSRSHYSLHLIYNRKIDSPMRRSVEKKSQKMFKIKWILNLYFSFCKVLAKEKLSNKNCTSKIISNDSSTNPYYIACHTARSQFFHHLEQKPEENYKLKSLHTFCLKPETISEQDTHTTHCCSLHSSNCLLRAGFCSTTNTLNVITQ